ncbi:MAG TPA: spermidine/putrescine ABC transporter substrate-binding protein [Candidatus Polarisedimenticolia bacterium]|nr:spermidine/putrescine ABC transporter substrate-binding protein [Candidatus Polarisedimenticolia bacterium]
MSDRGLDWYLKQAANKPINRRGFLAMAGLTGGAAALAAACGPGGAGIGTSLWIYNWSDYIADANITEFKKRFGITDFRYDTYANNEELIAKLQAGASGYDIAAPTAEYTPGMVDDGFLEKLDLTKLPNVTKYIDEKFKGLWWDPTNEYQVPKDFGTTGIMYRGKLLDTPPASWQDFYDLTTGSESGKVVMVDSMGDVFVFPLKMLGKSLNSNEPADLEAAREILLDVAPHILALDSDLYQDKLASEEASMVLGWTGPLLGLQGEAATADAAYVVPSEGSLFWMDTWVMLKDAPHKEAAYKWLDFIQEPAIQAAETEFNYYATCNTEAKKLVPQEILDNPAVFPPDDVFAKLEGAEDTSGNNQRLEIWEEFKSKIGG